MALSTHIDLEAEGLPGQWIDVLDPRRISHRKLKEFGKWYAQIQTGTLQDEMAEERFLSQHVTAWHVKDADSEEFIGDPSIETVGGLPLPARRALYDRIVELYQEQIPLALRSSRPPTPISS